MLYKGTIGVSDRPFTRTFCDMQQTVSLSPTFFCPSNSSSVFADTKKPQKKYLLLGNDFYFFASLSKLSNVIYYACMWHGPMRIVSTYFSKWLIIGGVDFPLTNGQKALFKSGRNRKRLLKRHFLKFIFIASLKIRIEASKDQNLLSKQHKKDFFFLLLDQIKELFFVLA